jgi:ethanolamine utilization protein EutA (predicted chaperonin)
MARTTKARRMNDIVVALIGAVSVVAVALIETSRRISNKRWEQNRDDHNLVVGKIDDLGKSLGRSIDRVEDTALRTEQKLDQHINDHVTGKLV